MMRKIFLLSLFLLPLAAGAQYQLPNPGFEQWDGGVTSEPTHWNSFASSDGSYSSLASSPHHYRRNGGRPGSSGSHFLTIYTKSILGIKANGNMTTGRIHAGSMSASSSDNYNYTQRSNSDFCQPFTGTPDSVYFWVSFYCGSLDALAQVSMFLHGDNDFISPNHENATDRYCGKVISLFTRTTTSATTYGWQQIREPFIYDGTSEAAYMLINITTNMLPGVGGTDDSVSIDDIEFIYSAWLTGITVAGHPVVGFEKGVFDYVIHVDNPDFLVDGDVEVVGQTEVADATVAVERQPVNDTTVRFAITVTAEDSVTVRHYSVTLTTGDAEGRLAIEGVNAPVAMKIYPNPAHGSVTIEAEAAGEALLTVTDLAGRQVLRAVPVTLPYTLPVDAFVPGLYHITLATPEGTVTRKLLVE